MSESLSSVVSLRNEVQQFTLSRRAVGLCLTRNSPPTSTSAPTKASTRRVELSADVTSGLPNPVAAESKAERTDSGDTRVGSDVSSQKHGEASSDHDIDASQHSSTFTSTLNRTPSSASDVTKSDPGASSNTGISTSSSLGSTASPFGQGNHENGISTMSGKSFKDSEDDPFRNPVQIPGCSPTTFAYPHSSAAISETFHDRYREVVNIFRHNTKEHPRLRENIQYIDYTLKLCGPSPRESHASILVFCRQSEFKALNGLLTSKVLKYQYCLRRSSRKYPWSGNQASAVEEDHKPLFNLYFWRQHRPRTLFWAQEPVRIQSQLNSPLQGSEAPLDLGPGLTMCGSIIELLGNNKRSFSTLGCVIKIESTFYAITSMHAFRPFDSIKEPYTREMTDYRPVPADHFNRRPSADKAAESPDGDEESINHSDPDHSDTTTGSDYFIDDIKYESLGQDDKEELDPVDSRSSIVIDSSGGQIQAGSGMRGVRDTLAMFPTPHELDESGELDLDWAIIELVDPKDWRPNAFIHPSISSSPVLLSTVAESQPNRETLVFIITREATPQRGMLQPGTSILGGINGKAASEVWTVVLCEQDSLRQGDSGSIVVDAATNAIYGHVIGSNPIGEIYIGPYAAILEQIQRRFPGSAVTIPEPIGTLSSLIDFYTMSLGRLKETYQNAVAVRSSHTAATVSGGQETPSTAQSTSRSLRVNRNSDAELAALGDTAQPDNTPASEASSVSSGLPPIPRFGFQRRVSLPSKFSMAFTSSLTLPPAPATTTASAFQDSGPTSKVPLAIPSLPTPKTHPMQYSVGQLDSNATPTATGTLAVPVVQGRGDSGMLRKGKQVEDSDNGTTSGLLQSDPQQSAEARVIEMLTRENAMLRQQAKQQHHRQIRRKSSMESADSGIGSTYGPYESGVAHDASSLDGRRFPGFTPSSIDSSHNFLLKDRVSYTAAQPAFLTPSPTAFGAWGDAHRSPYGMAQLDHSTPLHIVLFKCARADVFYVQETGPKVKPGDLVIVEADRGTDLGTVAVDNVDWTEAERLKEHYAEEHCKWLMMYLDAASTAHRNIMADSAAASNNLQKSSIGSISNQDPNSGQLRPKLIKRLAHTHEIQALRDKEANEAKAKRVCIQKAKEHGLNVEILDAEFQMDWKKLTFYYFADSYVNYNNLVTDLFKIYKTRVWMSAINPSSLTSQPLGLRVPNFYPAAVGVGRGMNAERQPDPQQEQSPPAVTPFSRAQIVLGRYPFSVPGDYGPRAERSVISPGHTSDITRV